MTETQEGEKKGLETDLETGCLEQKKKHRARTGGAAGHTTRERGSEDEQHSEDIVGS